METSTVADSEELNQLDSRLTKLENKFDVLKKRLEILENDSNSQQQIVDEVIVM
jgi:predicted  nucleic acid-binding Zn-ribbon protein